MALLIIGLLTPSAALADQPAIAPRPADVVSAPQSPVPVVRLPGEAQAFSTYDFNKMTLDHVEWPVEFIFRGNASVPRIEEALCQLSVAPWRYCAHGSDEFLLRPRVPSSTTLSAPDFVANDGVKRFSETCSDTQFTAHLRLYQISTDTVIGTVHLDYEDTGGCSGSIYGYPDVAEQWFIDAMRAIPSWTVTPDSWSLGNGSAPYVVIDRSHGIDVPYVYGQDALATDVYIN
jgi:hypothetical protein